MMLSVRQQGPGEGQPIVLLHGWGLHSGIWEEIADALATSIQVITIDLPGHGHSPMPAGDYTLEQLAKEIVTVIPDQAILMGWSLGGMIALQIACDRPEKISKLILVGSTAKFVTAPDWPHAMDAGTLESFETQLNTDYQKTLQQFLALQVHNSANKQQTLKKLQQRIMSAPLPQTAALAGGLSILHTADLRACLPRIQCPTLLISGQRDTLTPSNASKAMHEQISNSQLEIIKSAGHAPFLSHPQEFLQIISNFINNGTH